MNKKVALNWAKTQYEEGDEKDRNLRILENFLI
ncbi:hypothetical protein VT94_12990 [Clostridium sporogenes]|nr:hypothetical protein VT94_12990 [Clostridium sporogenes]